MKQIFCFCFLFFFFTSGHSFTFDIHTNNTGIRCKGVWQVKKKFPVTSARWRLPVLVAQWQTSSFCAFCDFCKKNLAKQ